MELSADLTRKNGARWRADILKLARWLESSGWQLKLRLAHGCETHYETRQVRVDARQKAATVMEAVLHECGHVIINRSPSMTKGRYSKGYHAAKPRKTNAWRIAILAEEIEAWHQGKALGQALGIKLDDEHWEQTMCRNVMSYVSWAARKDKRHPADVQIPRHRIPSALWRSAADRSPRPVTEVLGQRVGGRGRGNRRASRK